MDRLKDKVALITGASTGIGRAAARLFAREGARVVVVARRKNELDELVGEIEAEGGQAISHAGDVRDEACAEGAVETARARFGGLHIAMNNAGSLGPMMATEQVPLRDWESTVAVNLTSAFLGAKHQWRSLRENGGSLIFTSTFVGHTVGMAQMASYAAAKSGLVGLALALAAEGGREGIRVNVLAPGGTDTPMGRTVANSPEAMDYVRGLHALGRIASPDEIAQSALYLASDQSAFVTGTVHLVDGGVSIFRG